MNERIEELFQEAIDYADKTHTYTPEEGFNIQVWDKIRFEKFAELIVQECVKELENNTRCRIAGADKIVAKHFGVEE